MLSLKTFSLLLDRCQEKKDWYREKWYVFDKTQTRTSTKESKNGDMSYFIPRSSPMRRDYRPIIRSLILKYSGCESGLGIPPDFRGGVHLFIVLSF